MDYQWHYNRLIETRKDRILVIGEYYEKHHIVPRSMGGTNSKENLVHLTAREHFLAHWLLWRIYRNDQMARAFYLMSAGIGSTSDRKVFSSIAYQEAKIAKGKAVSALNRIIKKGHIKSQDTLNKMSIALKDKPKSDEHRKNIGLGLKDKPKSEKHRKNISISLTGFDWSNYSERNDKIAKANAGKGNGRAKKVYQLKDGEVINEFDTLKDANIFVNQLTQKILSKSTFHRYVSNSKIIGEYIWTYNI
jgi:hypothetical protein